ncbi:calmodulin-binding transcription activator 2-like [Asterias rubens]|uniref:calmodulin-binding transcription activator 2-like n=1 Tax=Asterias rubens TaxID=7604 RepID=UPI001454EA16|nr:calmodulin-binding transcription activator 2-like [Asterias rubens]
MGKHKAYGSNPRKRRRIRFVPKWLEKHGTQDGAPLPPPNSVNDPEAIQELILCAVDGNIIAVRLLAQAGVNVNSPDGDGWTALHHAASENQQDIVKVLTGECGADMSIKTPKGLTASDLAGRKELGGGSANPSSSSSSSSMSSPMSTRSKRLSSSSSTEGSGRY